MPDHIEEYVIKNSQRSSFLDLFEAKADDVDLKTDLTIHELILVNKIKCNNEYLKNHKLSSPYSYFLENYMRLKFSMDRKSRAEFVEINRKDNLEKNLKKFSEFTNIAKVKE